MKTDPNKKPESKKEKEREMYLSCPVNPYAKQNYSYKKDRINKKRQVKLYALVRYQPFLIDS